MNRGPWIFMRVLVPWAVVGWLVIPAASAFADPGPEVVAPGFAVQTVLEGEALQSFAWDGHGSLWTLRSQGRRLVLKEMGATGTGHSIRRKSQQPASLLVHSDRFFVADGPTIRVLRREAGQLVELPPLIPPTDLFPGQAPMGSMRWGPLGHLHFTLRDGSGIGRVHPRGDGWDLVAGGIGGGEFAFDAHGLLVAHDASSGQVFRVAPGLDYARGLADYSKADLALRSGRANLKASGLTVYSGGQWPAGNEGTWILFDGETRRLQQYREPGGDGRLEHWRDLLAWNQPTSVTHLQTGPDGALWFLESSTIRRLQHGRERAATNPVDVAALPASEVVGRLADPNPWIRDTALRVLDSRGEITGARGLHPSTPLHRLFAGATNQPLARVHALWALHRAALLDENQLETASDDPSPLVRAWAARLFGERRLPTGEAFRRLEKMAQETNLTVRLAVAVAARQFVSGSLVRDTPPPTMPLREVFTGGILSTLWFSTGKGSTPEFDQLYWNAIRPISAFDAAHPLGFFHGEEAERMPIAYWIVPRITRQVAETDDPWKQEDGMLAMAGIQPANRRLLVNALKGLQAGSANRRVTPTGQSLDVLHRFARSPDAETAALARVVLEDWSRPPPRSPPPARRRN